MKKPPPTNCLNCGCLFSGLKYHKSRGRYSAYGAAKTCSYKCQIDWISNNEERKAKISAAFSGDKHPNWQGGKARINSISRRGTGWQKARRSALKRDGFSCRECGCTNEQSVERFGRGLDVDHVIPFHNFTNSQKANRLSNLVTRCASCHRKDEAKRVGVQMALPLGVSRAGAHKGYVRGQAVNTAKLNEAIVARARQRNMDGEKGAALAREYGLSKSAMSSLLLGKAWKHVPMPKPRETQAFEKAGI